MTTVRASVATLGLQSGDCAEVDETEPRISGRISAGWLIEEPCTPGRNVTTATVEPRPSGILYGHDLVAGDSQDFAAGVGGWTAPDGGTLTTEPWSSWIPYTNSGQQLAFNPSAPGQRIRLPLDGTFEAGTSYALMLIVSPSTTLLDANVEVSIDSTPPFAATFPFGLSGVVAGTLVPLGAIWRPEVDETDPVLTLTLPTDDIGIAVLYVNIAEVLGGLPLVGRLDVVAASPEGAATASGVGLSFGGEASQFLLNVADVSLIAGLHQLEPLATDVTGALIVKHDGVFPYTLALQTADGDDWFWFAEAFPADGAIPTGTLVARYDPTPGSAAIRFRGKNSSGAVVSGAVALA